MKTKLKLLTKRVSVIKSMIFCASILPNKSLIEKATKYLFRTSLKLHSIRKLSILMRCKMCDVFILSEHTCSSVVLIVSRLQCQTLSTLSTTVLNTLKGNCKPSYS